MKRALVTGSNGGLGRAIVERLRGDGCVSNAGVVDILAPAHSMSPAKWDRDLAVNLTGAFRVIQAGLLGTPKVRALPDELLDRFREGSGLLGTGRVGEPEEIAGLVAYLASPEAGYVTGQEIVVAGGGDLMQVSLGSSRP